MKSSIISHEFLHIIEDNPVFSDMKDEVIKGLEIKTYKPDEYIIQQGHSVKYIFFVCKGKCEIMKRINSKNELFIDEVVEGEMHGHV